MKLGGSPAENTREGGKGFDKEMVEHGTYVAALWRAPFRNRDGLLGW
jgi:hypothetical protein